MVVSEASIAVTEPPKRGISQGSPKEDGFSRYLNNCLKEPQNIAISEPFDVRNSEKRDERSNSIEKSDRHERAKREERAEHERSFEDKLETTLRAEDQYYQGQTETDFQEVQLSNWSPSNKLSSKDSEIQQATEILGDGGSFYGASLPNMNQTSLGLTNRAKPAITDGKNLGPLNLSIDSSALDNRPTTSIAVTKPPSVNILRAMTVHQPTLNSTVGSGDPIQSQGHSPSNPDSNALRQTMASKAHSAARPSLPPPPTPQLQVAVQIVQAVNQGIDQIKIQLSPAELGRVDVQLNVNNDGRVSATVIVDRPETLELLRNDSRGLERALNDSGLRADQGSLSFNLRDQYKGEDNLSGQLQNNLINRNTPDDDEITSDMMNTTPSNSPYIEGNQVFNIWA